MDRGPDRGGWKPVLTFLAWLVPLFVAIAAGYVAWETNLNAQRQASAIIRPFAFPSSNHSNGEHSICRTIVMLSNIGGIGTAAIDARTSVIVGREPIVTKLSLWGSDDRVGYDTAIGIEQPVASVMEFDAFPHPVFDAPVAIGPGTTVKLVIDTKLTSRDQTLRLVGSRLGIIRGVETVALPDDGWISAEYHFLLANGQEVRTGLLPCTQIERG